MCAPRTSLLTAARVAPSPSIRIAPATRKRHDFGYRNYGHGLEASPLDSTREFVNYRSKVDLYTECAKHSGPSGSFCRRIADDYVAAAVIGGGPSFCGN
jgi:hypothetical protein